MTDSEANTPIAAHQPGTRTSDYDYVLPAELIAQEPVEPRDASRLLVVNRTNGDIAHRTFADLAELIPAGDVLVVNTTRVFRARLLGQRESGSPAEILLLRRLDHVHYEAMVHPGAKLVPGKTVTIAPGFTVAVLETTARRTRIVRLQIDDSASDTSATGTSISDTSAINAAISDAIERHGHIPLPPYIERSDVPNDVTRYQTVYAERAGSVAAPTAGLHFTPDLLARLEARGVMRADVLLHVGAGTFRPVHDEDPAAHVMHEEWCEVTERAATTIAKARAQGGRVWAVGTTSVRTLETAADDTGAVQPVARETNLFLRPPYTFRAVDHLVTNFHTPRSSLLMLVAAFAGYELTMRAYEQALAERYRFYSYGDAMCVL